MTSLTFTFVVPELRLNYFNLTFLLALRFRYSMGVVDHQSDAFQSPHPIHLDRTFHTWNQFCTPIDGE